eukprot:2070014-Pleurochrysis_carterae.AAC.1
MQVVPALAVDLVRLGGPVCLALGDLPANHEHSVIDLAHHRLLAVHLAQKPDDRRCHLKWE